MTIEIEGGREIIKECDEDCENCPIPLDMIPDDWNCRHIKNIEITKDMYRKALHFYLVHAYPDDDVEYYSKWGWIANKLFWEDDIKFPFPTEARFGCHVSGHTKLRCYPDGFMFDKNCVGDSYELIIQLNKIASNVEKDWDKHNIPIHMRNEKGCENMTRIRVGIGGEEHKEIEINKPFEEIGISDIYNMIGEDKRIIGWAKIDEGE